MARVTHVKKARKAIPEYDIAVGDEYYWWKFRFGGKHVSKTYPCRSQLTQSDFLATLWDAQDACSSAVAEAKDEGDFEAAVEELKGELETLRDECEEKRSNLPESLQDVGSGEMLQNRYDQLEEYINNLEGISYSELEDAETETEREAARENIVGEIENADPGVE